jgi:hypothetical protein
VLDVANIVYSIYKCWQEWKDYKKIQAQVDELKRRIENLETILKLVGDSRKWFINALNISKTL